MANKTFLYRNKTISYQIIGNGKPVLLLHGFAEDGSIWNELGEKLSANYQIIIPHIPGSGDSELLSDEDAGITGYAEVVNALIENENISSLTLIGHSMGGYIALAFAEKYAGKLNALGLFHSSAYADDAAKVETRKKGIEFIKQNGAFAFLKTSIPGLFADAEKSKEDIDQLIEKGKAFSNEALIQYYEAMIARPDRTVVLRSFSKPILFLMGEHDKAVPFEHSLQQTHLPQLSHIQVLRDSAHMGMFEEKEKSFHALAHFLQAVYV